MMVKFKWLSVVSMSSLIARYSIPKINEMIGMI